MNLEDKSAVVELAFDSVIFAPSVCGSTQRSLFAPAYLLGLVRCGGARSADVFQKAMTDSTGNATDSSAAMAHQTSEEVMG
ncbi:unnamed protein product [Soboliphyme baturini]|uniref:Serpin domain-containing protein n=1 Tax=Soboliphyme baturini TaxID=241478 RepID=A0A183IG26_9BILA|nr:unnamed protein product [Soboliphyme baturini]